MKIPKHVFSLVPDCHAQAAHYATVWGRHFYDGLRLVVGRFMIPEGIDFKWARTADTDASDVRQRRAATSEQIWDQLRALHSKHGIDVVISCCFANDLEPGLVQRTIQLGIPWINFYCDSTHRFPEVEALARVASLNWYPEHAAIDRYAALGVPHFCRPYAYNPEMLRDAGNHSFERSVAFVGVPTSNRITQIGWLQLFGCDVSVRGFGWVGPQANPFFSPIPARTRFWKAVRRPDVFEKALRRCFWPMVRSRAEGPLENHEFAEYLASSQIILGLNQGRDEHGRLLSYMKLRDLEFPGYGCCYLTEHNRDIEEALEVGKEVLTCHSMLDAACQIREIRDHPERARQIGRAGRKRVLENHTWTTRLSELAAKL